MPAFIHTPHVSWIYNSGRNESVAACIHQFKTEAKQCDFMNNAATNSIFSKRIKNAQSLAARIYKKDPHTLTDTITKIEKLNAAKQLTVTIIPS